MSSCYHLSQSLLFFLWEELCHNLRKAQFPECFYALACDLCKNASFYPQKKQTHLNVSDQHSFMLWSALYVQAMHNIYALLPIVLF